MSKVTTFNRFNFQSKNPFFQINEFSVEIDFYFIEHNSFDVVILKANDLHFLLIK